ncbi:CCC motif membrane protein [Sungkyunkwania multivorans]|uniref:CCC motif membrane protein n=1 Tax=Sungkyunkwania multivorans TaxID=1173618 RepID=A0ABW3D2U7_9FLAO
MNNQKLPADSTSLVLSIIAAVIVFVGCCCGIGPVIALTLAIIALSMANKSLKLFREAPENFSPQSRGNVNASRIISITAIIISGVQLLFWIGYFIFYGTIVGTALYDAAQRDAFEDDYNYEEYNDSLDNDNDWEYYESETLEKDTLKIDTIEIEVIEEN